MARPSLSLNRGGLSPGMAVATSVTKTPAAAASTSKAAAVGGRHGAKNLVIVTAVVSHGRYVAYQMAAAAIPRNLLPASCADRGIAAAT
jgi:hypothetical protein